MKLYETLELQPRATAAQIRSAYRRLAAVYHPDKNPTGEQRFHEISHAYKILSDPDRKARYDRTGRDDDVKVTPAVIQGMVEQTVIAVIMAERPDGSTDDPTWEDIKSKILRTIRDNRREPQLNLKQSRKRLSRLDNLAKRFKSKTDADPVGDAFAAHRKRLVLEVNKWEDALELSHKVEEAFAAYDYLTGDIVEPESEGQVNPGSTARISGTRFIPDLTSSG